MGGLLDKDDESKEDNAPKFPPGPKKVLLVVTNYTDMPATAAEQKEEKVPPKTGWYLPEVAHPYNAWKEKGYEITMVSPSGGDAACDISSIEAFANDEGCKTFTAECMKEGAISTVKVSEVEDASKYHCIYFAGGHGVMWDFPDDKDLQKVSADIYEAGGIVSAVCHGPAALVNIKLSDDKLLIDGKTVTCFTNDEEDAIAKTEVMPFKLESELKEKGAKFSCVKNWGANVAVDERLVTGQNPASADPAAKAIIELLEN